MENQKMMSKGKKWLIGTIIVLIYMFFVWFYAPVSEGGGWIDDSLLGKSGIVMLFFGAPVIFGYFIFCLSVLFSKNQPFLPQKETIKSQSAKAFIIIPIIALIVLIALILPYFK